MSKTRRDFGKIRNLKNGKFKTSYPAPLDFPRTDTNVEYCRTFESKYEAERWLNNEQELIHNHTWTSPRMRQRIEQQQQILFKDYANEWLNMYAEQKPLRDSTREKYEEYFRNHLFPAFGETPVVNISQRMVNKWIASYGDKNQSALEHVYRVLKQIMQYAATNPIDDDDNTLITRTPCVQSVKKPTPQITDERLTQAQKIALANNMPERYQLAVYLLFWYGLRISELLALRRCDIDLETRMLHVTGQVKPIRLRPHDAHKTMTRVEHTKTAASTRHIPIPEADIARIQQHLQQFVQPNKDAILFPSTQCYGYMWQSTFRGMWQQACLRVLGRDVHFRVHDARHQCVSETADTGLSDGARMSIFGHTDMKTHVHYQNMRNDELIRDALQTVRGSVFEKPTKSSERVTSVPSVEHVSVSSSHEPIAQCDPESASSDVSKYVQMITQLKEEVAVRVLMGYEPVLRARVLGAMSGEKATHLLTLLPEDMQVDALLLMV